MTDLRNFLTQLGLEDARSLLQSGNVVFTSKVRTATELERFLESEAADRLSLEVDFFVRTPDERKSIIRQNPFRKEAERDPGRLVVLYLKSAPSVEDIVALESAIRGPETVRAKGKQAYIYFPDGQCRSNLTNALLGKHLGRASDSIRVFILEFSSLRRVAAWLVHSDQPPAFVLLSHGVDRLAYCRGMVREIVDYGDTPNFSAHFHASLDALERAQSLAHSIPVCLYRFPGGNPR